MASFLSNLGAATRSLREQWQRAALSALGIMVGAVAVLLLVAIATGVQADITRQVQDIGVNVLVVIPGRIEDGTFNPNLGGGSYLKEEDAKRLAGVDGVVRTTPWTFVGGGIRNGKRTAASILVATTPAWFAMREEKLEAGRTFLPSEGTADVCVIGSVARKALFGEGSAIGKKVTINGHPFAVVGVTKDQKSEQSLFSMGGFQNLVYIPYHRQKQLQPDMQTDRVMVQIRPEAEPRALIKRLDAVLAQRLDRQQFQVLTQEDLLGLVYKLMGILTWLLTGLTSIALFVGGVGIMAVMLMSVNERAYEIGIRKTVGARRRDIFVQFLLEAILLALIGSTIGLAFSAVACALLAAFTPIKPILSLAIVGLAAGTCLAVGIVFGLIPALNAARKDPVDCLRSA
ncbi:MAG: ABC transporter permease [Fimbriimonas sp.]